MKRMKKLNNEEYETQQKELTKVVNLMIDFFELNNIPIQVGVNACISLFLTGMKKTNCKPSELREVLNALLHSYQKEF